MAKKGQKFSKYSNEVVDEVLNDFFVKKYSAGYIYLSKEIFLKELFGLGF